MGDAQLRGLFNGKLQTIPVIEHTEGQPQWWRHWHNSVRHDAQDHAPALSLDHGHTDYSPTVEDTHLLSVADAHGI
jgi:hypothetical protein